MNKSKQIGFRFRSIDKMERRLLRPKSSYISSQQARTSSQKIVTNSSGVHVRSKKRKKRKIHKSNLLLHQDLTTDKKNHMTNLKHFINVLTNHRKSALYNLQTKDSVRLNKTDAHHQKQKITK